MGRTGCKEKDMHLRDTFVTGRNGRVTHVHLGDGYTYLLVSPLLFPRESTIPINLFFKFLAVAMLIILA